MTEIDDKSQKILKFIKMLPPTGELKWNNGWLSQHCCTAEVFKLLQLLAIFSPGA
jgi:hypothetical protein